MSTDARPRLFWQLLPPIILGVAVSVLLFSLVFQLERRNSERQFRELADHRLISLRANLAVAVDSVSLLGGHFAIAPAGSTSRAQFRRMVQPVLDSQGFVQGFSWDPLVPLAQKAALEDAARLDGLPDFRFTERDDDGKSKPVGQRPDYVPVFYMEPMATNTKALGFDLASNPVRRQALESSRDNRRAEATGRITLVQEYGGQYGVLLLSPVFDQSAKDDLVAHQGPLIGYVSGVFRIGDLVDYVGKAEKAAAILPLVELHLFDLSAPPAEQRLYPKQDDRSPEQLRHGLYTAEKIGFAGRDWLVVAIPSSVYQTNNHPLAAYIICALALMLSALHVVFLKNRIDQANRATAFAAAIDTAHRRLDQAHRIARLACIDITQHSAAVSFGDDVANLLGMSETSRDRQSQESLIASVHPDDQGPLRNLLQGRQAEAEIRIPLPEDKPRILLARTDWNGETGKGMLTLQDITARKAAEEERAAMIQRLAESSRLEALGTLAGGIAHEINTPAQYVRDNLTFLHDGIEDLLDFLIFLQGQEKPDWDLLRIKLDKLDLGFLSDELPSAVTQAQDGIARIAKIVQAIKEFSYPSSKTPKLFDLNHVVDLVTTVTRNQWRYVADLKLDLDPDLPAVIGIEGEINQVLVNLIVNSAQALADQGQQGGLGEITLSTRHHGGWVELSVRDNGPGIPTELQAKIFEMFFTTKPPGQGTGQGLAISRAILRRHGGDLSVTSAPGAGACFTLHLPLHQD